MIVSESSPAHRVVVVIIEGALVMDVGIPLQVFADRPGFPYQLRVCAETAGIVNTSSGIGMSVPFGLEALEDADTVIVPGFAPASRPTPLPVCEALVAAHARGARIVSICYGAFALAEAGLLEGLRATTHWEAVGEFAHRYPNVQVEPDVLFVDEGSVLTSAGVAAGLDLCLYIVRKDLGAKAATEIARRLVTAPRRSGGQSQFIPTAGVDIGAGTSLDDLRAWAAQHLGERLTVRQLAERANLSTRTFERRFAAETGTTPHRWLLRARLDAARLLLEDTDLPIDRIAGQVGLGTGANLRLHFRRSFEVSPVEYRRTFTSMSSSE
ncbi:GlxA family transcriptional regulator [Brevibacterium oceani]|uniref:GlxA family transcriptional regulator n=1 Tax=Brevibacterium oceani TaxID=358099 RepID=UPI0015E727AE|nr:helix-turn-helix domain-containing protein [Brevibacterium oceani]